MSASASWSYTAKATLWPLLGRDDWAGQDAFGAPVAFDCDYSAKAERRVNARGVEFVTRQLIYTEFAQAKQGDFVLIGESTATDPVAAGALEIRAITRYADTFDRAADDFEIAT
ncbi:hypothetical protein [Comamonas terrae]|uniref:Uncharacterized protein n=1 Tax=Comamonas terrae TaxID=673548 RepID=A0ABW5URW3_9BURK|nr:hypothetical protein [Comamonas terrae]